MNPSGSSVPNFIVPKKSFEDTPPTVAIAERTKVAKMPLVPQRRRQTSTTKGGERMRKCLRVLAWLHSIPRLSSANGSPATALQPGNVRRFSRKGIHSHFLIYSHWNPVFEDYASHLPLASGFEPWTLGRSCRPSLGR